MEAAEAFKDFLVSGERPNNLTAYLKARGMSALEKIMRDSYSLNSELGALVAQAEEVCKPDYYLEQKGWFSSYLGAGAK